MMQSLSSKAPLCCWRNILCESSPHSQFRRSLVSIQRGPSTKLDLPPDLPKQFWSQLPKRLRPDRGKREIVVHPPTPSTRDVCKDPVSVVESQQLELLDPTGGRRRLFDKGNKDGPKVGDILLVTFKTGEPFSGVILSIKSRGPHSSVLLRNQLTRVGTEMEVKIYSPLVQSMEVAQKTPKRKRRARLYYLRKPKHDVGSVQKTVDHYLRQRALLTGGKTTGLRGGRQAATKSKSKK